MPDDTPKDIDRFIKDIDRNLKDIDRLIKDIDRGPKDIDRFGSDGVVEDVFRRASGLNGFLVVSFVAPVAGQTARNGTRRSMLEALARKAEARQQEAEIVKEQQLARARRRREELEKKKKTAPPKKPQAPIAISRPAARAQAQLPAPRNRARK
jgi:hypothetical protein